MRKARVIREWDNAYAKLRTAGELLLDKNLVWSEDMESIRKPLGRTLRSEARLGSHANPDLLRVADALLEEEWDISA
mgnify:CR=1 FL=1